MTADKGLSKPENSLFLGFNNTGTTTPSALIVTPSQRYSSINNHQLQPAKKHSSSYRQNLNNAPIVPRTNVSGNVAMGGFTNMIGVKGTSKTGFEFT